MKVCLLAPVPPPAGGIAGWTKRMMGVRLKDDWEVVVVDEQVIGGRTNFGETSKKHLSTEIKRCFKIWKDLSATLKDKDVVVVQSCVPAGVGSLLRESVCQWITHAHKRKFIAHFRCTVPNMVKSKVNKELYTRYVNGCDSIFLLNKQSLRFSKKLCPNKKYYIIPNFVDNDELYLRETVRSTIKKIVYTGGVIPEKGCKWIIAVARKMPEIEFRLIGKIGIDQSDIPENVILCGEQSKDYVSRELKDADAFIFLSKFWGEGFSNALAEAMANSLPCIVTDWAANADMVDDGKGGVVIYSSSVKEVVNGIKAIENPDVRLKMGQWNYKKVVQQYSQKIVTDKYVDVYESLAKEKR